MKTSLHLKEDSKPSDQSTGDEESCVEEIFLQVYMYLIFIKFN